jgi:hypothetical protein
VPQFFGSDCASTQAPEHEVRPVPHVAVQVPLEQTLVLPHAVPHTPQLAGSERRSVQVPLQAVLPTSQVHMPVEQILPPEQVVPHVPQFAALD